MTWWTNRFGHPIHADYSIVLTTARPGFRGMTQQWMVVPKHPLSHITKVGIAAHGQSGWSVQWSDNQDPYIADSMAALKAYVDEHWILCAPIPYS